MRRLNRPVTSREYKLMLNVDRFEDRHRGVERMWRLIVFLVERSGGTIAKTQDEQETRRTRYLDTPAHALRQQGFTLRLREEMDEGEKEYKITLKYRDSDRYVSAAQDVSVSGKVKYKFEEDILPPFVSRFSHSSAVKKDKPPEFGDMEAAANFFPGLKTLGIPGDTPVETVNGFTAHEAVHKVGKILFGEEPKVKACFSFWYLLGEANELPLVGEFSFDYDLPEKPGENELEQYPTRVVAGANGFFTALQKQMGWIDFDGTTKTAYAYRGF